MGREITGHLKGSVQWQWQQVVFLLANGTRQGNWVNFFVHLPLACLSGASQTYWVNIIVCICFPRFLVQLHSAVKCEKLMGINFQTLMLENLPPKSNRTLHGCILSLSFVAGSVYSFALCLCIECNFAVGASSCSSKRSSHAAGREANRVHTAGYTTATIATSPFTVWCSCTGLSSQATSGDYNYSVVKMHFSDNRKLWSIALHANWINVVISYGLQML